MASNSYNIVVTDKVRKILLKLPASIAGKIENVLLQLSINPRPPGCKKLKGRKGYRIRSGDYRIIYEIEDNILKVIVIDVGHRKDIYH
jgi:mRNA interferase RelE/StbE